MNSPLSQCYSVHVLYSTYSFNDARPYFTLHQNDIMGRRNSFSFDVTLRQRARGDRVITGNDSLIDLRDFPILNVMPSATITGEVFAPYSVCTEEPLYQDNLK